MTGIENLIESFRQQTGTNLRREWIAKIRTSLQGTVSKSVSIKLYENWLSTDITETSQPVLPPNIKYMTKVLNINYTLQVTSLLDISTPCYQQYLKLKDKVSISEIEGEYYSESPAKRMYLLELTDGCATIYGIEYKPIHSLTPNVLPGAKIVLKGMIPVRKGYVFLENSNVEVLGGSVPNLIGYNSTMSILSRELDIQIMQTDPTTARPNRETNSVSEVSLANEAWLDEAIDQAVEEQLIQDISINQFMDEGIEFTATPQTTNPSPPNLTLREISHFINIRQDFLAHTHCKVYTLLSKLDTNTNFDWQLKATLISQDNTKVDMRISNEILQNIIGFSGREFKEVIEPNKLDPLQKQRGKNGFMACQSALKKIDCKMLIRFDHSMDLPVVEQFE